MFNIPSRFILVAFLLSALGSVITLQNLKIKSLRLERDAAQQNKVEKESLIRALHQQAHVQEVAQLALQQQISQIRQRHIQQEATIRRMHEMQNTMHHWANTRLPKPIIRLREHDAFTGTRAYLQHLPESGPVHAPRERS